MSATSRHTRLVLGLSLFALAPASVARANGAFPDSSDLLLPADRPELVVLGTNFGLVTSEDGGTSWSWTCESELTTQGRLYQLGVPGRLFGVGTRGLAYTDDLGCKWQAAGGALADRPATDAFVDPTNPERVLAIAAPPGGYRATTLHESSDGGRTFGDALYTAAEGEMLASVETARSNPKVTYLAIVGGNIDEVEFAPRLARSTDGGASWETFDLTASLGKGLLRIISVDPDDPDRILLRVSDYSSGESVAVSTDGGHSFAKPVQMAGRLTSFVRRANGTLLVSAASGSDALGFRSSDGGDTFEAWPLGLHARALAERDGRLYAAADDRLDGFALAVFDDDGLTWQPVLRLDDIKTVRPCVEAACISSCLWYESLSVWSSETCGVSPSPGDVIPTDGPVKDAPAADGGGCAVGPRARTDSPAFVEVAAVVLAAGLFRTTCRSGRRSPQRRTK